MPEMWKGKEKEKDDHFDRRGLSAKEGGGREEGRRRSGGGVAKEWARGEIVCDMLRVMAQRSQSREGEEMYGYGMGGHGWVWMWVWVRVRMCVCYVRR